MWFCAPLRSRRTTKHDKPRLRVEALEDRSLLAGGVTLAVNDDSILVGERVTWTATATDVGAAPVYQFSAAPHGGTFHVLRDFSPANAFAWTPMQEGTYDIEVTVKDGYQAGETTSAVVADEVGSLVTGSQAVVTPALNPLVALYSVPPSSAGTVFVQFAVTGDDVAWRNTDVRAVVPGKSTNFYVAGMLPSTTYQMRHVFSDGTGSASILFTTGSIPSTLSFPAPTVQQPSGAGSELNQDMVYHSLPGVSLNGNRVPDPYATDLAGRVMWYYDTQVSGLGITNMIWGSLEPGGTVMGAGSDRFSVRRNRNVLREIDMAGNPVRETNLAAVNEQLAALGFETIYGFSHEIRLLPNGDEAVLAYTQQVVDVNGVPTDYMGDMVVVLDRDFHVTWAWDPFDHLDVHRGPTLPAFADDAENPPAVVPNPKAIDWVHANAVSFSPVDGNLVLSLKNQDWVIKIDYRNGTGDGHVVWRLGEDGNFNLNSTDAGAWFSHQHNAHFIDDHTLILFDNGNLRHATDPNAHSRGQVWRLDEQMMTATPLLNTDLGNYSYRLGAAQRLANGNYSFTSGCQGQLPNEFGETIEVRPDGTKAYALRLAGAEYRSYRMRTLYEGNDDELAGAPRKVESIVLNDGSAQRSIVNRITITFDGAAVLDPRAIELRRQDGSLVDGAFSISLVGGKTVAVVTFAGAEFVVGSLADGDYTLTVLADHVHDRWGRELDGDGDGSAGGNRVDGFSRLFGDSDGDGDVDWLDRELFRSAFKRRDGGAGYLWYFDSDGDGEIDGQDNGQFDRRFGKS